MGQFYEQVRGWRPRQSSRRPAQLASLTTAGLTMLIAVGASTLTTPSAAQDSSFNPVEGTQGFLVVSEGDVFLGADEAEGAVAVGGDLSFGGYNVMQGTVSFVAPGDDTPTALLVRGQVDLAASSDTLQVLDGMYAKVGDPTVVDVRSTDENGATANTRIQPEGTAYGTTPNVSLSVSQLEDSVTTPVPTSSFDFDQLFASFRERSAGLAACPNTVQLRNRDDGSPIAGNEVTTPGTPVRIGPTPGEQNVLDIDAQSLNNISEINYDQPPTADTPLIINVDTSAVGGEFDWTPPNTPGVSGADAPYILWNFSGATRVTLSAAGGSTVEGTIYAPDADVQHLGSYNVEGNIIAATFEHGVPLAAAGGGAGGARDVARVREVHNFPFAATLTPCDDAPPTTTSTSTSTSTSSTSTTSTTVPTTSTSTVPSTSTSTTSTTVPTTSTSTVPSTSTTVPGTSTAPSTSTTAPSTSVTPSSTTPEGGSGAATTTTVPPPGAGSGSGGFLPRTGTSLIGPLSLAGLGLLAAGSVALRVARRIR